MDHLRGLKGQEFSTMQADLLHLYGGCDCCTIDSAVMASVEEEKLDELAQLASIEAERIWRIKGMPENLNPVLTEAYASIFMDALAEGYGIDLAQIDYTTADGEMIRNLTNSVYNFSSAKNYTQLRQLTQAILGEDGKIRTFSEFKRAAFTINNEHTVTWLSAEYDTAIASSQMASKWVNIQNNKSTLPFLQFDAVLDTQTSPICRPLDGVIKSVEDPFWDVYYPPNHYRCRSGARQLRTGRITPDHQVVHPEKGIPDMFKTNMAKTGVLFPSEHPYFIGAPDSVFEQAQGLVKNIIDKPS